MRSKRVWLSGFLVCIFIVMLTAIPVQADDRDDLGQAIIESCKTGESLDLQPYEVDAGELGDLFWELYHSGQLPWYTDRKFNYDYQLNSNIATTFHPILLSPDDYDYNRYEQTAAEILDATVHTGMEDWQIALSIHDYLIAHYSYDETLTHHKGYDLLVEGSAVCDGYTEAYMDLMNRAGIDCVIVVSEAMGDIGHAWNLVKLEDDWYHVDVTWDDPTPDCYGRVSHEFFLKTDAQMEMADNPHYGWDADVTCTDTTYAEGFWQNVNSPIWYLDAETCCVRIDQDWDSHICLYTERTDKQTTLYTDTKRYVNLGAGDCTYQHLGLSLWNGRLYFSSLDTVYSLLPDGSGLTTEYSHDLSGGSYILGSFVEQGTLFLTLSDHDFTLTQMELPLSVTDYHVHAYTATEIPPSCLGEGLMVYRCGCGVSYDGETLEPTGHSYTSACTVVEAPTLFREGLGRYDCDNCEHFYTEAIPRLTIFQWLGLE